MLGGFSQESQLIDAQDGVIAVFDDHARCLAIYGDYAAVERYADISAEDAIGRTPDEFIPEPVSSRFRGVLDRVVRSREPGQLNRVVEFAGERFAYQADFAPLETPDGLFVVLTLRDFSELRSLEQKLNRSEERYRDMIEQALDVFAEIDAHGRIEYVSPNAERVLGYLPERLLGVSQRDFIHPDDWKLVQEGVREMLRDGKSRTLIWRQRHADGRWLWLESSGRSYRRPDGTLHATISSRDVTARVEADKRLEESERRYRILADSAFGLVVEVSETLETRFVSAQFAERAGIAADELIGVNFGLLVHPDDAPRAKRIFTRILAGSRVEPYVLRFSDGSGGFWYAELLGSVLSAEGEEPRVLLFGRDITTELEEQEARRVLEGRVILGESARSVALLASGVSHDLNNLLSISMGLADLIRDELPEDSPYRAHVGEIIEASASAADLSRQLVTVTHGPEASRFESIDLIETTRNLEALLRAAVDPGVRVRLDLPAEPCWVDADRSQIGQLLVNLVRGAGEAVADEFGQITISASLIEASGPEPRVVLEIKDTGPELEPADLGRLFDARGTARNRGRGLGLSVAQRIVAGHGGTIEVDSTHGEGGQVRIEFPLLEERSSLAQATEPGNPGDQAEM